MTPIRTKIDNALVASIGTITDFIHIGRSSASIFLNPSRIPQDSETKPYVLVLTDAERVKKSNQYRQAEYIAEISVWGSADNNDSLYPLLVDYMAKIQKAIIAADSLLRQAGVIIEVEETGIAMDTYFYETGMGVGISQYLITYRTVYGDPYNSDPT